MKSVLRDDDEKYQIVSNHRITDAEIKTAAQGKDWKIREVNFFLAYIVSANVHFLRKKGDC